MVFGFKNNWRDGEMKDVETYINTIQWVRLCDALHVFILKEMHNSLYKLFEYKCVLEVFIIL